MDGQVVEKFQEHFGKMKDPRVERTKLYPLEEILFVLLCGSICGAESWRDFVMFGQEKLDFLREYFPFSAGIPCKNTFARVSAALEPEQFRACFIAWAASLQTVPGEVIAIDGKTLCNSANACTGAAAIHMVSAFGTDSRLVLAQQKVAEKSNEITAIPALLDLLDVTGHIITIDAMGCQRSIAKKIRDRGADYVLALKGNQGTLNDDVRMFLESEVAKPVSMGISDTYSESDAGHGRVESRRCVVSSQIDWLEQKTAWSGLTSLAMIEETREFKGRISVERRFFISSLPANARQIAQAVRAHWAIENTLHWTLDVVFNEDRSTVRKDHAPQNMAIVRHVVLNILNTAKKQFKGIGVKTLRKKAAWGNENLRLILKHSF
ncbi:Mobile element protein [Polaromonas sp. CG9_12]|nr:Mobile element protein [Polaromonas sp. CG9_12]CDS53422.1 Mobile element protein [Polaromonas sp. CG9_12]